MKKIALLAKLVTIEAIMWFLTFLLKRRGPSDVLCGKTESSPIAMTS
jgi:hypothetical protein